MSSQTATPADNEPNVCFFETLQPSWRFPLRVALISFRAASLASRLLSSRCSACCAPPAVHKPCIIPYLAGSFVVDGGCLSHTRGRPRLRRKRGKKKPWCHPESSIIIPILFPAQKDHLLAAHDSVRRKKTERCGVQTPRPAPLCLLTRLFRPPGLTRGAVCLSFMSGNLILRCRLVVRVFFSDFLIVITTTSSVSLLWAPTLNEISRLKGKKWIKGTCHRNVGEEFSSAKCDFEIFWACSGEFVRRKISPKASLFESCDSG